MTWNKTRTAAAALAAAAVALAGCGSTSTPARQATAAPSQPAAAVTATPPPAVPDTPAPLVPRWSGKYSGSCDYTLGSSPASGTANLIGEVDLDNTGNIGTVVKVGISWPQLGYPPVTSSKTVRVPYGAAGQAVMFHVPAGYDVIDRLQSWQERHGFADGCTYTADITGTYGQPHA